MAEPTIERRAVATVERRDPSRQRTLIGGDRATDPPLTTRDVADYMGYSTEWVRNAIDHGVQVASGVVKLEAVQLVINNRRNIRIPLHAFITFLERIGWAHIPKSPRAS